MGYYGHRAISYKENDLARSSNSNRFQKSNEAKTNWTQTKPTFQATNVTLQRWPLFHKIMLFCLIVSFVMCGCVVTTYKFQNEQFENEKRFINQMMSTDKQHLEKQNPKALLLPNFALDSLAAQVIHKSTSRHIPSLRSLMKYTSPDQVITGKQYPLTPGQCWPAAGQKAQLTIKLFYNIHITSVTVGHITKNQSPQGEILSAPREFTVYGRRSEQEEELNLGTFEYDSESGVSFQTFKIHDHTDKEFQYVRLAIDSNHGHPHYTCLYNFKVHGELSSVKLPMGFHFH